MDARTLADIHEDDLLAAIFPTLPTRPEVRLGVGDDTALLAVPSGAVLITTDSMVLGRDFLDEWSDGVDVGRKLVTQNLADVAAMGGYPTAVVVSLMAGHDTTVQWCKDFNEGVAQGCSEANVAVVGGDLSSAPHGSRVVSITAMGELPGTMVLRSGARAGDVVAVCDALGRSDAGLRLLQQGRAADAPALVDFHRRPQCRLTAGPQAAAAGATAMIDISDGLVRDARRIASASGVRIELGRDDLEPFVAQLAAAVDDDAWACVLSGGEEHTLLACFPDDKSVPGSWTPIGRVTAGEGVGLDGDELGSGGWDHFGR
ncbi:thiamine-phosphate kinase [Calidifontibacter terrae]